MSASPQQEQYEKHVGRIARGAGIGSFGQVIERLLNYGTQIALARMYGPALLGLYVLGVTVIQIANLLAQFGLNQGALRYIAHYQAQGDVERVRGTILMALWVTFALSVVLAGGMFFGASILAETVFDKPALETVLRAFSVALPFFTVMVVALWVTKGFQTVKYEAYVQKILRPLLNLAGVVVLYLLGAQLLGAVAAYVFSVAVAAAIALYYLRRLSPRLLRQDTPPRFEPRELFGFSLPMIVVNFSQNTNSSIMVILVGAFAASESVSVFNVAFRTAAFSALVLSAFGNIFAPMVSNLYSRSNLEDLGNLYRDVSRWTFTGTLIIFLVIVVLARDIMAVFGPEFVSGWVVMVIIAGARLYDSSTGPSGRALAMSGHQNIVMLITLGSAAAPLALGVALIPRYGIVGAGVAAAAGIILANTISLFFIRRLLGLWPYDRRHLKPLIVGLLAAAGAYLVKLALPFSTGVTTVLVIAPLFLVCFAALVMTFGLSPTDRQFLNGLWKAVLVRIPARRLKRGGE